MARNKSKKAAAPQVTERAAAAMTRAFPPIRAAARAFGASVPMPAQSSGHADLSQDARFTPGPVPDGRYRVAGTDWILTYAKGRPVAADRAVPPDFGGAGVVSVPND